MMRRLSGLETGATVMVMEESHDMGKLVTLLYWDFRRKQWWTICRGCRGGGFGGDFLTFYHEEDLDAQWAVGKADV